MLLIENVSKSFDGPDGSINVLKDINFDVPEGSSLSIVGPSGSGKTTLLGLCAGLDHVSKGRVILNNITISSLNEDQRAKIRNDHVGFVFQNFQLLPTLTALENVMVPLELQGVRDARRRSKEIINKVGLSDRCSHFPSMLSGGEQQRIAVARAFSNNPKILFADEPTGNLDEDNGKLIESLIFDLNQKQGATLVIVTHNLDLASKTKHLLSIKGGRIAY